MPEYCQKPYPLSPKRTRCTLDAGHAGCHSGWITIAYGQREQRVFWHPVTGERVAAKNVAAVNADLAGHTLEIDPANSPRECQVCARQIMAKNGIIAHHGYKRPVTGWQTESCFGARHLPYAESRDQLPPAIESVEAAIERERTYLAKVQAGTVALPSYFGRYKPTKYGKPYMIDGFLDGYDHPRYKLVEPGENDRKYRVYTDRQAAEIAVVERRMEMLEDTRQFFQSRYDRWFHGIGETAEDAAAKVAAVKAPPEPGTRAAKIAENKAKREEKERAYVASMALPCALPKSTPKWKVEAGYMLSCAVHGHGSPWYGKQDAPCSEKRDWLKKEERKAARQA
jgi:hypothetical protein